jgi:hypothetical protein
MWLSVEQLVAVGSLFLIAPPTVPPDAATSPARVTVCDAPIYALPPSIRLEGGLEPTVRWALEHSPTFRLQCRRLAAQQTLTASVRVTMRWPGDESRARAVFRQNPAGGLDATIEIGDNTLLTELLGHELEHVLERLEGVDLVALTQQGQARRLTNGAFETRRAIEAGQRVSGEVVDNAPDRVRRTTGSVWRALRRLVRVSS